MHKQGKLSRIGPPKSEKKKGLYPGLASTQDTKR